MKKIERTSAAATQRPASHMKIRTRVRAGGDLRRQELDHIGAYNFAAPKG